MPDTTATTTDPIAELKARLHSDNQELVEALERRGWKIASVGAAFRWVGADGSETQLCFGEELFVAQTGELYDRVRDDEDQTAGVSPIALHKLHALVALVESYPYGVTAAKLFAEGHYHDAREHAQALLDQAVAEELLVLHGGTYYALYKPAGDVLDAPPVASDRARAMAKVVDRYPEGVDAYRVGRAFIAEHGLTKIDDIIGLLQEACERNLIASRPGVVSGIGAHSVIYAPIANTLDDVKPVSGDVLDVPAPETASDPTQFNLSGAVALALDLIRTDGGTQTRAALDMLAVADYAQAMKEGARFPAVIVYHDGADYWLADGFHRERAARDAGQSEIAADVRQGTRRDAVLFSVGANAQHGVQRKPEDKRRAVETLLRDDERREYSDGYVAKLAHVSQSFASKVRRELEETNEIPVVTVRRGADGRVTDTAQIGVEQQEPDDQPLLPTVAEALAAHPETEAAADDAQPASLETVVPAGETIAPLAETNPDLFAADSQPIDPEYKTAEDLAALLKGTPQGLHAATLADMGYTPGLIQHAQSQRLIERGTSDDRYTYVWKPQDVADIIRERGPQSLLDLEDLGCTKLTITAAANLDLIERDIDDRKFIIKQPAPTTQPDALSQVIAPASATKPEPTPAPALKAPVRPAIEELLNGRKLTIGLVWIPGLGGKVSVSVNATDSPTDADRKLLTADELRPLPETIINMIAAHLEKPVSAREPVAPVKQPAAPPIARAAKSSAKSSAKSPAKAPAKTPAKQPAKRAEAKTATKSIAKPANKKPVAKSARA